MNFAGIRPHCRAVLATGLATGALLIAPAGFSTTMGQESPVVIGGTGQRSVVVDLSVLDSFDSGNRDKRLFPGARADGGRVLLYPPGSVPPVRRSDELKSKRSAPAAPPPPRTAKAPSANAPSARAPVPSAPPPSRSQPSAERPSPAAPAAPPAREPVLPEIAAGSAPEPIAPSARDVPERQAPIAPSARDVPERQAMVPPPPDVPAPRSAPQMAPSDAETPSAVAVPRTPVTRLPAGNMAEPDSNADAPTPDSGNRVASLPPADRSGASRAAPSGLQMEPGTVHSLPFGADSTTLDAENREMLSRMASALGNENSLRLQLRAYADGDGRNVSQARRLSLSRALTVRKFLIDQGMGATRIDVRALGSQVPGGPGDRVDIEVMTR